jgi:hypothetical protein
MKVLPTDREVSLESRLVRYGVAAGSVLAATSLPPQVEAAIVYHNVPDIVSSGEPGYNYIRMDSPFTTQTTTFAAAHFRFGHRGYRSYVADKAYEVYPAPIDITSAWVVPGADKYYASKLSAGFSIGPSLPAGFIWSNDPVNGVTGVDNGVLSVQPGTPPFGTPQFSAGDTGYVGLKFDIPGGSTHYGWAQVTVVDDGGLHQVKVLDWAYESAADTAITAGAVPEPQETALVMLLGAAGVAAYREHRRRKAAPRPQSA